jgi:hypothetical protein
MVKRFIKIIGSGNDYNLLNESLKENNQIL